ncbi:hypothetical protein [Nitrococcus mobilis]|uniref:Acetylornithine deacetylase n=1 Tax=Nitrococcus mobilis Nb-231 TaxID=314278 RepID=A4BTC8_9GAMM|nr:hypothetical protein [Nitrococcus mobilis]EAR21030.1 acetylornithine deacetylase [Nitrococcus mobilis Nb-231]
MALPNTEIASFFEKLASLLGLQTQTRSGFVPIATQPESLPATLTPSPISGGRPQVQRLKLDEYDIFHVGRGGWWQRGEGLRGHRSALADLAKICFGVGQIRPGAVGSNRKMYSILTR